MNGNIANIESIQSYPKEDFLKLIDILENWVKRQRSLLKTKAENFTENGEKETEAQENDINFSDFETLELPRGYFRLLESKLQSLSQRDKSRLSDNERDRVLKIFLGLKSLSKEVYPGQETQLGVRVGTVSILSKYSFLNFTSLKQFEDYIQNNTESTSWNSDMLGSFLSKLYVFIKGSPDEQKNRIIQSLFEIPGVKSCLWTKEMLKGFGNFVYGLKSDVKGAVLRRFNALPKISNIPEMERVGGEWRGLGRSGSSSSRLGSKPFASASQKLGGGIVGMYPYK